MAKQNHAILKVPVPPLKIERNARAYARHTRTHTQQKRKSKKEKEKKQNKQTAAILNTLYNTRTS